MADLKTLILKRPKDGILNEIVDFIIDEKTDFVDRAKKVQFVEGTGMLLTAGDQAYIKIVVTYDAADEKDAEDIKHIIEYAKRGASDISVEIIDPA
ncbi:MAG: hypothetical protein AAFY02_14250 [Pseudomonadota bacterium]